MIFSQLAIFTPLALLLLRIVISIEFIVSGWNHTKDPKRRGKDLGVGTVPAFTLGVVEIVAGLMLVLGIYSQIAALALMLIMVGAISMKIVIWKIGYYKKNGYGWQYDLYLLAGNAIVVTVGAGSIVLLS